MTGWCWVCEVEFDSFDVLADHELRHRIEREAVAFRVNDAAYVRTYTSKGRATRPTSARLAARKAS